ncbi:hypothetical protein LXL04_013631 [Taraxacum kok-saghyz]
MAKTVPHLHSTFKTSSNYFDVLGINNSVLKTGLNRPVGPVQPGTGEATDIESGEVARERRLALSFSACHTNVMFSIGDSRTPHGNSKRYKRKLDFAEGALRNGIIVISFRRKKAFRSKNAMSQRKINFAEGALRNGRDSLTWHFADVGGISQRHLCEID